MKVNIKSSTPNYNYKFETAATGIIGVYGVSGSGKSSLLNAIAGYQDTRQGVIEYRNKQLSGIIKCSYMQQQPVLFPHWTIQQNLDFALQYTDNNLSQYLLQELQVTDLLDKLPAQLSGGEKQRIAYIRALLQIENNSIVLLDEPYSALDKELREVALNLLAKQSNCLIMLVSHKISELYKIADEILYIADGSIKYHANIAQVMSSGFANMPIASKIAIDNKTEIIYADDVSVSLAKNPQSSIINQISTTIAVIETSKNIAVLKLITDDAQKIYARITLDSLNKLKLKPQQQVIANFKAVAYQH